MRLSKYRPDKTCNDPVDHGTKTEFTDGKDYDVFEVDGSVYVFRKDFAGKPAGLKHTPQGQCYFSGDYARNIYMALCKQYPRPTPPPAPKHADPEETKGD